MSTALGIERLGEMRKNSARLHSTRSVNIAVRVVGREICFRESCFFPIQHSTIVCTKSLATTANKTSGDSDITRRQNKRVQSWRSSSFDLHFYFPSFCWMFCCGRATLFRVVEKFIVDFDVALSAALRGKSDGFFAADKVRKVCKIDNTIFRLPLSFSTLFS